MIYEFDGFELDTQLFELRQAGQLSPLERQVFDVLAYLVEHRERVVTKGELFDEIWKSRFVSEATLSSRIMAARRAIGDDGKESATHPYGAGTGLPFSRRREAAWCAGGDSGAGEGARRTGPPGLRSTSAGAADPFLHHR